MYYAPLVNHVDGNLDYLFFFKISRNFYRIIINKVNNNVMTKKTKESIHQQFERYMRDEMDDIEKKEYLKSNRYKSMLQIITKTLSKIKK